MSPRDGRSIEYQKRAASSRSPGSKVRDIDTVGTRKTPTTKRCNP